MKLIDFLVETTKEHYDLVITFRKSNAGNFCLDVKHFNIETEKICSRTYQFDYDFTGLHVDLDMAVTLALKTMVKEVLTSNS